MVSSRAQAPERSPDLNGVAIPAAVFGFATPVSAGSVPIGAGERRSVAALAPRVGLWAAVAPGLCRDARTC